MRKLLLLTALFIFVSGTINAQKIKVKFKKGIVSVDEKECLNYESTPTYTELITLDETQTIILKYIRTGIGHNGGLYTKVIFVEQEKSLTSKSFIFTKKLLVKKLIANKVLSDCNVNEVKIDKFILKYDEDIEETLVRH